MISLAHLSWREWPPDRESDGSPVGILGGRGGFCFPIVFCLSGSLNQLLCVFRSRCLHLLGLNARGDPQGDARIGR